MSKKTFNPTDWVPDKSIQNPKSQESSQSFSTNNDIEEITRRIESAAIDIAPNYADWRDLGFALADELRESGRAYYHRLSRFYQDYNPTEADKQFDACLKAHGHGVSIKTFYHLAKSAGINVGVPKVNKQTQHTAILSPSPLGEGLGVRSEIAETEETSEDETSTQLCSFPPEIFNQLPDLLHRITVKGTSPEDKDILLLGSLVSMSACLPNIYGVYAERKVFPNLFLFVTAQASAGKGRLTLCRKLVEPIHKAFREQNRAEFEAYQRELTEYAAAKSDKVNMEKPQEPPLKMLVIPANNSATGLFQILNDNNGKGLIFETEGDTLAMTFKSEHGNYSDGFRKAFHHETISYNRRKDREFVELASPQLSALLSGTPKQVSSLIPNAENGLFSRFMFYFMNLRPIWKDVFAGDDEQPLEHKFDVYGKEFLGFNLFLRQQLGRFRFAFSSSQQKAFNAYFEQTQLQYLELCGDDYVGSIRRLGLIAFRLAMIMTALRIIDTGEVSSVLVCTDTDFNTVMEIVKVLVLHAAFIFELLPKDTATPQPLNHKRQLLDALPAEFDRQTYLSVAKGLNIPDKTAEKQIARFVKTGLIIHFAHDKYKKP